MTAPAKSGVLLPLVTQLRERPTRDERPSAKQFIETWSAFKQIAPEHGDAVTPAIVVGVILYDTEVFAPLLNGAEHAQLQALGKVALERYLQITHPPHKLGKTLAAAIKEQT